MTFYTDGDYNSVLRNKNKPNPAELITEDLEMFLLDFFPCDQYTIKKIHPDYFQEEKDSDDEEEDEDEDESTSDKAKDVSKFLVRVFGVAHLSNPKSPGIKSYYSISLDLINFQPFFYIKVPETFVDFQLDQLVDELLAEGESESWKYKNSIVKHQLIKRKPFYGFTGDHKFNYAELTFNSLDSFKYYHRLLEKPIKGQKYERMESNIEPMLRLIHIKDLTPSGWVKIPANQAYLPSTETSDCQLHYRIDYTKLQPINTKNEIPPLIYAAYDIEADSSHGDFPLPKKSYKKLSQDIMTEFLKLSSHIIHQTSISETETSTTRKLLEKWVHLAFNPYYYNPNISQLITEHHVSPNDHQKLLICEILDEIGPTYHQIIKGSQGNSFELVREFHENLEILLPPLDLKKSNNHYFLLAQQLLNEYHRMLNTKNLMFQRDPHEMIKFWLDLAYDECYNNHTIHWVETKYNLKPSPQTIHNMIPQIDYICREAYHFLVTSKKKAKTKVQVNKKATASAKITRSSKEKKSKEQQKGQTRMSSFFSVKKSEVETLSAVKKQSKERKKAKAQAEKEKEEEEEEKAKAKDKAKFREKEEEEIILPMGRYKKEYPERLNRDFFVGWLDELFNEYLPEIKGDEVIQIGTTYKRYGEKELFLKHIITLKDCSSFTNDDLINDENQDIYYDKIKDALNEVKRLKIENPNKDDINGLNHQILVARKAKQKSDDNSVVRIECYDSERQVLLAWQKLIKESDPDILLGYNIFGFDFEFMYERAKENNCWEKFRDLSRIKHYPEHFKIQQLSSSGLGDNILKYIPMTGRVIVDMFKVVQTGGYRLPFYKLDYVCKTFLSKRKNDLPPEQIFIHQKGTDLDRSVIARYCLMDCILCNRLIDRLETITNNIGMSQVCTVPLSYLFLRGQGIKILSLVSKICRQEGFLIRTKEKVLQSAKFEGAIVLEPKKEIYFRPSVVADFNSLYPSCMIAENLSHDSYVEIDGPYDNLPDCEYVDIEYDIFEDQPIRPGVKATHKVKVGVKRCRFYQPKDGAKSLLPRTLQKLLKARKDTRKEQKKFAKGSFEWNVKEGLQLAYKVTANSLYGQVGAKTSPIFLKEIAACTTASGRKLIHFSKDFVLDNYPKSEIIYGDSVTGDTPLLLRDPQTKQIHIKTIDELVQSPDQSQWIPYEGFKATDLNSNRREKQQAKTHYEVWSDKGWTPIKRVIRHKCQKKIYRVQSQYGIVKVTEDHSLLDINLNKIKPTELTEETGLLHSFPDSKDIKYNFPQAKEFELNWITKSAKEAFQLYSHIRSNTPLANIIVDIDKNTQEYLLFCPTKIDKSLIKTSVTDLGYLPEDEFVYDLETELGRFHAGVGELIVKNTDSIFIAFDTKNCRGEQLYGLDGVNKSIELCVESSLAISRQLKYPHNLEFEKAIFPFMLLSKKRYHGHYYTQYGSENYFAKSMGIVLKRRDNADIVKHVFGSILNIIMRDHDINKAMEAGKKLFKEVLDGNFPLDKFVITKTLKSYYKNPDQIAHNVLAQRIGERDPGNKPQSNDRLPYAYIKIPPPKKDEKILQGNRIETPNFIKDHNQEIDYKFYLTNQIMKPVSQIFELVMDDVTDLFFEALMEYERRQSGVQRISKFYKPDTPQYKEFQAKEAKRMREEKARLKAMLDKMLEEDDDVKAGDDVLEYGDPMDNTEY